MYLRSALQCGLALALMPCAHVDAAAIRCGTNLIVVGDLSRQLLVSCGRPADIDGATWIYDLGPDQFTRVLQIRDEKVISIEDGPYGTPEHGRVPQ